MKTFLLSFLICFPFFVFGQRLDSTIIKEVDSLIKVSQDFTSRSEFDKAIEVNEVAEKFTLEKLGRETATYGSVCYNKGKILFYKGDYIEAEKWYLNSTEIREKILGKEHPDYASSINNLASLLALLGQYERAEPLFLEAKTIREKVLGKQHPDYALTLGNLAALNTELGQYEKAEPLYIEAKAIREKALGKEHPEYAWSVHDLAILYTYSGQYEKAEILYLEAKSIQEKILGKEHPDYAETLDNLGHLYLELGQNEKAEILYLEAKSIQEKLLGKEHPLYAVTLNQLGDLYEKMGLFEKAEPLFLEAKDIREKALGKKHKEYGWSLASLADLYTDMGQYDKAELLYLEVISIINKALGKENPDYTGSLNSLAILYNNKGNNEKAEPLYLEALEIWVKAFGKEHKNYNQFLNNLAIFYYDKGDQFKAMPLFEESAGHTQFLITKAMQYLSERELSIYLNIFKERQSQIFSFSQATTNRLLSIPQTCFNNTLFYKGFLLNAANQIKRLAHIDSTTTQKYNLLKSLGYRLAKEYAKPIVERDSVNIVMLEDKANTIQKDLARTVAGFGEAKRQVKWQEIQQKLKANEAALEFVDYQYYHKNQTDSIMYAALLICPKDSLPLFIPLFEEKQLANLLKPDNKVQSSELLAQLYTRGATPVVSTKMAGLYQLIWKPIDSLLSGVKTIYYSPSGLLHRINFDAIPINKKQSLSDRFKLVRLGSTRSLVVPDLTKVNSTNDALLYGGIQYEIDTTSFAKDSASKNFLTTSSTAELSFTYADRSIPKRGENWGYLQGTEKEVLTINQLLNKSNFKAQVFSGKAATEESFKSIGKGKPSPRILHIATHGFFFPDPKAKVGSSQLAVGSEPIFKISDHPMIRSGLILAGGNYAWKTGKPIKPDMEDGILTAYEISQMNLSNTELVVLSACETGLGDIQGNEGVYGLQRAFKIAGAKYLIMSLWQVPDLQTQELMVIFYENWLQKKMTIPDAFRTAQKEMREKYQNPYFWAGFVLVE